MKPVQPPIVTPLPSDEVPAKPKAQLSLFNPADKAGSLPIPKSADPGRQAQNLDVFGFDLTDAEMKAITGLSEEDGRLFGGDPDTHEEM